VALPRLVPGLVIRYAYLWAAEHARGQEEGVKDRPCAIVLTVAGDANETVVTVLPITHSRPPNPRHGVEIPYATKRRLGLDDARSWVVLTEANRFVWPGPDLRPAIRGDASSMAYGLLPYALFEDIRLKFIAALKARIARTVPRTE
jgi:hypothetical protein